MEIRLRKRLSAGGKRIEFESKPTDILGLFAVFVIDRMNGWIDSASKQGMGMEGGKETSQTVTSQQWRTMNNGEKESMIKGRKNRTTIALSVDPSSFDISRGIFHH